MTNESPVYIRVVVAVYPRVKDVVALGLSRIKVIVALHIVHNKEVGCSEAPEDARPRTVGVGTIDLINPPIVGYTQFEFSRVIGLSTKASRAFILWRACIGIFHSIFISAEINLM